MTLKLGESGNILMFQDWSGIALLRNQCPDLFCIARKKKKLFFHCNITAYETRTFFFFGKDESRTFWSIYFSKQAMIGN